MSDTINEIEILHTEPKQKQKKKKVNKIIIKERKDEGVEKKNVV